MILDIKLDIYGLESVGNDSHEINSLINDIEQQYDVRYHYITSHNTIYVPWIFPYSSHYAVHFIQNNLRENDFEDGFSLCSPWIKRGNLEYSLKINNKHSTKTIMKNKYGNSPNEYSDHELYNDKIRDDPKNNVNYKRRNQLQQEIRDVNNANYLIEDDEINQAIYNSIETDYEEQIKRENAKNILKEKEMQILAQNKETKMLKQAIANSRETYYQDMSRNHNRNKFYRNI